MIVPQYWAEHRVRHRDSTTRVTVLRFGWSDESQGAAEDHARERADEALARILAGEDLRPRENRVPYNGADGLPIREEVLERHLGGEVVVTRNSYGARCLNVSDVLFADVDFDQQQGPLDSPWMMPFWCLTGLAAPLVAWGFAREAGWHGLLCVLAGVLGFVAYMALLAIIETGADKIVEWRGGRAAVTLERFERFVRRHPEWRLRIYETPAGLRALAMHRTFDPVADWGAIRGLFRAVGGDRTYERMCQLQRCFRARVSPKPWRIGIDEHLRPRPGVWPVDPARRADRDAWVERYEARASGVASCRFLKAVGSEAVDPKAAGVRDLHDRLCGALESGRALG